MAEKYTKAEVARARIAAIHKAVKNLSIEMESDPAEAVFELLCVAVLFLEEARPIKATSDIISEVAPNAAATVEHWFHAELKAMRGRHV